MSKTTIGNTQLEPTTCPFQAQGQPQKAGLRRFVLGIRHNKNDSKGK